MKTKFIAKKGSRISNKDAAIIGKRIKELMTDYNQEVTPPQVVEDAKSRKSPLHKYFEWNDTKAGEQWRLQQARVYMGAIVEVVIVKDEPIEVRSFYHVKNEEGDDVYVGVETVSKRPDYTSQLIDDALQYISYLNNSLIVLRDNFGKKK